MYKSILVPFDGSPNSELAVDKAVEMAALCGGAALMILTVYRHHSMLEASLSMVRPDDPGNMDDAMRTHAEEVVGTAKERAKSAGKTDVRAFVKAGPTSRNIVKFVEEHGIDLVVIGRRGMGSMEGYLLGSVSQKVTYLSPVPVLIV